MTHLDDGADLRAVMDRTLRDLDVPDHCGPAALASGRRIRTRRRVTVTLTGVAAVAAVAALTLPALGGLAGDASPQYADDPTSSPAPSDVPVPQPEEGWWSVPSARLAEQLAQHLPEGVTVETVETTVKDPAPGQDPEAVGSLWGTLSASTGPGAIQIILYPPELVEEPDEGSEASTSTPSLGTPSTSPTTSDEVGDERAMTVSGTSNTSRIKCRPYMETCEPIVDANGEPIGRLSTVTEFGTLYFDLALLGPDGGALYFYVADSTGEKPGYEAPTAEVPPLSLQQLRTLAEDPGWTSYQP